MAAKIQEYLAALQAGISRSWPKISTSYVAEIDTRKISAFNQKNSEEQATHLLAIKLHILQMQISCYEHFEQITK